MWADRPTHGVRINGSEWVARPLPPGAGRTLCSAYENYIHQGTDLYKGSYRLGGIRDRVSGVDLQPPVMQRHRRDTQLGRRMHRTPELPTHGFRLAVADLPGRRRGAARSQAQELHPGVAGVDTAGAPRGVGTGTGTGARAVSGLLRQVRHSHHRRRQVLPGMRSLSGILLALAEKPAAKPHCAAAAPGKCPRTGATKTCSCAPLWTSAASAYPPETAVAGPWRTRLPTSPRQTAGWMPTTRPDR
jgi:hypothetical protein